MMATPIPRNQLLISSTKIVSRGDHAELTVFSRGGLAGTLTVSAADAGAIDDALQRVSRERSLDDDEVEGCECCGEWFRLEELSSMEDGGWICAPCAQGLAGDE